MKRTILILLLTSICFTLFSQSHVISGIIKDGKTGETLLSANIYDANTMKGTVSNNYGFFSLILPKGKVKVICSYIGYQSQELEIDLTHDQRINFELSPTIELDAVIVSNKSPQQKVRSTQMSMVELPIIQAKQLPVLLGEVDIIKSLQLMPGVQSGTEGSTGIYVRGGGPDQNLILLDGVPVYNVNHLFGFFSVFNADAIKGVSLTKGGFPARYGGRLSSVIDIRMKEGNMKELHGEGSIGLLSSKFTLEGPIKKDKTSFIVSGRRTYFDILTYPIQAAINKSYDDDQSAYAGFFFYDVNAKVNHIINDKNRVYLSAYMGSDKFYLRERYKYEEPGSDYVATEKAGGGLKWGNATAALRWNHLYSNRLFSNMTLTLSDYTFKTYFEGESTQEEGSTVSEQTYNFEYYSRIRDYGLKYDFEYHLHPAHYLRFGLSNTVHTFSPGVTVFQEDYDDVSSSIDTSFGRKNIPTNEFFAYAEDEIEIGNRFKVNVGLHYSNFYAGDTTYHSLEPRLSGRFLLTDNISLKASYVRMSQYINLLSNSTIGLPTDLWVPCTQRIHPQKSWQAAFGAAVAIGNQVEVTLEGFYKKMENLVEYSEGASFFELDADWEKLVTQGKGESYGIEFFAQKSSGKTTGWIGYTLSWSLRQFDDISFGQTFPFRYDRRHDISAVLSHRFSDRFDIGLAWVYGTGTALTLADEKYASYNYVYSYDRNNSVNIPGNYYDGSANYTGNFDTRNSFRMPNYHRLDIGFNFTKQKPKIKRVWSFGMYNTYGRQNAFFVYESSEFDREGNEYPVLKQVSILTFIPYLRYSLSF